MLALIVLARLVEIGVEELAGDIDDALDRAGDRGAVDVDVEHAHEDRDARTIGRRQARPRPRNSRGGGTVAIIVTSPSAGAMISPSPCGVVRIGSRKKAATQMVSPASEPAEQLPVDRNANRRDRRRDDDELAPFGMDRGPAPLDGGGRERAVGLLERGHARALRRCGQQQTTAAVA